MSTSTRGNQAAAHQPTAPGRLMGMIIIGIIAAILLLMYMSLAGRKTKLTTEYGERRGAAAATSVNGTAVLARMFEAAGHHVTTFTEMNRRLDKYNTLVWVPDSFMPPSDDARKFAENWVSQQAGRTFIYIGRDYDAGPEYWQRISANVEPDQWEENRRQWAQAAAAFDGRRTEMPVRKDCGWFVMDTKAPTRVIYDLDGPWSEGIDAAQVDITLAGRLDLPHESERPSPSGAAQASTADDFDNIDDDPNQLTATPTWSTYSALESKILLQSENDILVHSVRERWWSSGKIIVVANGSFTLNMPLVNKENRKLAGKLIAECGAAGDVAFLESGAQGITVREGDRSSKDGGALRLFTIWPISFIVMHFAILGIAYCFYRFPIFGTPRSLPSPTRVDFGKHVAALGELLQRTKDSAYAESRIKAYQTVSKRHSGQLHRKPLSSSVETPRSASSLSVAATNPPTNS